jgi:Zn-dependent metalloprotease
MSRCHFIPPYLLHRVATSGFDVEAARCGDATLAVDQTFRGRRMTAPSVEPTPSSFQAAGQGLWTVYTASNGSLLPGTPVRAEGEPESGDPAVDEAYAGTQESVALFSQVFGRKSYDGRGAHVVVTVHYEKNYDNAFWDGHQLVFGDGDGKVFGRFTKPIDVLGHEFTHAVTQHTSGFVYQGQPGALNESISDVFAACLKQRVLGQSAAEADWLIGEGIFMPSINARALRSMSAPGTAYDDPVIGRDPQVGSMADYVETTEDNGGVHINSGIPNRAFHLVATALGGPSWGQAGQIWYDTLVSDRVNGSTDFAEFATATVEVAQATDSSVAAAVADAWTEVGVSSSSSRRAGPGDSEPPSTGQLVVRRSGGFAGITQRGSADLDRDPRAPQIRTLLSRIDFAVAASSDAQPDRYSYDFELAGRRVTVYEQDMTREMSELVELLLRD